MLEKFQLSYFGEHSSLNCKSNCISHMTNMIFQEWMVGDVRKDKIKGEKQIRLIHQW